MISPLRVYAAAPVWVQNVLISAYGYRLRRLRFGRIQRETLAALRESQWRTRAEVERAQLDTLNATLAAAARDVPFHRARAGALAGRPLRDLRELAEWPTMSKRDIQGREREVVSARWAGRSLNEIHTGGTTGTPLTVFCDTSVLQRNYGFFFRLREWAGIPADGRVATFAGRTLVPPDAGAPYWRRNAAARTMLFSSYHMAPDTLGAYLDALAAWQPALIDSYPSSLEAIARAAVQRGERRVRPRGIITSSETLFPEVRALAEEAFGCRVFDHYGSAEMAALIAQCEHGTYHATPEFGVVEILREDGSAAAPGERGEIVATGFINPVMPFIRYRTGDTAIAGEPGCPCGRQFPVVARIEGRMDDVLVTPEGRLIGRLDPIFKAVASLHETRIVQDAVDHVRVEMVVVGDFPAAEEATLRDELQRRLGPGMRITMARVPSLPRTRGGKLRAVVNEVTRPASRAPGGPGAGGP